MSLTKKKSRQNFAMRVKKHSQVETKKEGLFCKSPSGKKRKNLTDLQELLLHLWEPPEWVRQEQEQELHWAQERR